MRRYSESEVDVAIGRICDRIEENELVTWRTVERMAAELAANSGRTWKSIMLQVHNNQSFRYQVLDQYSGGDGLPWDTTQDLDVGGFNG